MLMNFTNKLNEIRVSELQFKKNCLSVFVISFKKSFKLKMSVYNIICKVKQRNCVDKACTPVSQYQ